MEQKTNAGTRTSDFGVSKREAHDASMFYQSKLYQERWFAREIPHRELQDTVVPEPGKWADFIVIDRDYFAVPESEIDDIQVLETWIGGKRVYARPTENQDND